jgi:Mn2+/Fe2+ NRAMP family transporter
VFIGGFRLFEKIMSVCIAIMFVTVVVSAIMLAPDVVAIFKGLFLPHIPKLESDGVSWTMALMGGVGGTVTILCYGYWIAEIGRKNSNDISVCRIDLGVGYLMTALFGIAMVIIASSVKVTGSGTGLIVATANALQTALGPAGRWMFLIGAFGAVFSSLLGVWQSVPYLFADLWRLFLKPGQNEGVDTVIDTRSLPYRAYLVALATIPTLGLLMEFRSLQKLNGMVGAAFLPLITIILLLMNGRKAWMGQFSNRPLTVLVLVSILLFFGGMACSQWLFE